MKLSDLKPCFEGVIPAVIATSSADGTPNITHLSRVRLVDDERIALSNQFFSKTAQNLAENPRASLLLIDPLTFDQYRLTLVYERTDRRGVVFDMLREDVEVVAALHGMQDVFKLRSADVYRVVEIERIATASAPADPSAARAEHGVGAVAEFGRRLGRSSDLNAVVNTTMSGLAELFAYTHVVLMLLDESGTRLYTIASRGYEHEGVGSEVGVGDGVVGTVAAKCAPVRYGNARQVAKYANSLRQAYEESGAIEPGREIALPGLADAASVIAVPAMALGELVGVLLVESRDRVAFGADDEDVLTSVASMVATAINLQRAQDQAAEQPREAPRKPGPQSTSSTHVRYFEVDGSTFVDNDYLIKGVAGRILWSLLQQYEREGRTEFTNREVRLDPSLELPSFKDNFESRLLLLQRRLDERGAPIRIEKTARGRFALVVEGGVRLDAAT